MLCVNEKRFTGFISPPPLAPLTETQFHVINEKIRCIILQIALARACKLPIDFFY